MSEKIISTGKSTSTTTTTRMTDNNTKVIIEIKNISATNPSGGSDIPGSVQIPLSTECFLNGFSSAKFADNGNGTVTLILIAAFASKKPNTSPTFVASE